MVSGESPPGDQCTSRRSRQHRAREAANNLIQKLKNKILSQHIIVDALVSRLSSQSDLEDRLSCIQEALPFVENGTRPPSGHCTPPQRCCSCSFRCSSRAAGFSDVPSGFASSTGRTTPFFTQNPSEDLFVCTPFFPGFTFVPRGG